MRGSFDSARLIEIAETINEEILKTIGKEPEMKDRLGGYACNALRGVPIVVGCVGHVAEEKCLKYFGLCQEKTLRTYISRPLGHKMSRQSANETYDRYPGAVAGDRWEWGFSGYPGMVDEIFSAAWAVASRDLSMSKAREILADNTYFKKLGFLFDHHHLVPRRIYPADVLHP